jgi:CheY-like chemotaxis protein
VEEIQRAGNRAAGLTRQLLAYSRRQVLQPVTLQLNRLVADMETMLRRLIGEDIELITRLDPDLRPIKADPGQIEQVVMNLVVNARDAMPRGGRLTITTANVTTVPETSRRKEQLRPGSYVQLVVSDTGCGMDRATLDRIFEPFFTTKEMGKGTGLGLATVYGIITQSGGQISAESAQGAGATFTILLPASGSMVAPVFDLAEYPALPQGREKVLLVEDEEGVRLVARRALELHGYDVVEARNGEEALRTGRGKAHEIDLLITDVIMPHLSGHALAEELAALSPRLRVLYMSGYPGDAIGRHGSMEQGMPFLQKPFSPAALVRRVREVLDQPAPERQRVPAGV